MTELCPNIARAVRDTGGSGYAKPGRISLQRPRVLYPRKLPESCSWRTPFPALLSRAKKACCPGTYWSLPIPPFNPLGLGRGPLQLWASWHDSPLQSWHWVPPHWAFAQSAMPLLYKVSCLGGNNTNSDLGPHILIPYLLSIVTPSLGRSVGIFLKSISKSRFSGQCPVEFIWTSKEPKCMCLSSFHSKEHFGPLGYFLKIFFLYPSVTGCIQLYPERDLNPLSPDVISHRLLSC